MEELIRTENLIGKENVEKIKNSKVAVFGIGGVGSFSAEALARCGVGEIMLIDSDVVSESNINRQLIALHSTVGKYKVDVMKDRILDINPDCRVIAEKVFYDKDSSLNLEGYDYIIDAIDTVTSKLILIENAKKQGIPIISSMGTGNKLCPEMFEISDIYKTTVCPLARVMRRELKSRGIDKLKVLYSKEEPKNVSEDKRTPASISFVPSVAGLMIAGEVIKDIIKK